MPKKAKIIGVGFYKEEPRPMVVKSIILLQVKFCGPKGPNTKISAMKKSWY